MICEGNIVTGSMTLLTTVTGVVPPVGIKLSPTFALMRMTSLLSVRTAKFGKTAVTVDIAPVIGWVTVSPTIVAGVACCAAALPDATRITNASSTLRAVNDLRRFMSHPLTFVSCCTCGDFVCEI